MNIAIALAKLAKAAPKSGMNIIQVIEAAGAVVEAANILIEQVKPLVGDVDMQAVANGIKAGANGVAKGAGEAVGGASEKAGALFAKFGDAKNDFVESLAQAKGEKELKKAIRDARQSVLENSTMTITVADMLKAKEKTGGSVVGPINNMPGCFVIATYRKLDFDNDLTDYTGIFVGKADDVSEGVFSAISRAGDPDVYADVKFKQNVHVYVYSCRAEDLDGRFDSLLQTFADDRLYGLD